MYPQDPRLPQTEDAVSSSLGYPESRGPVAFPMDEWKKCGLMEVPALWEMPRASVDLGDDPLGSCFYVVASFHVGH